jgi:hypothetical protein
VGVVAVIALACLYGLSEQRVVASHAGATTVAKPQCDRETVRSALLSFLTAYNQGELSRLDSMFAPEPAFQWYSVNPPGKRLRASARRRATLIDYFRVRHEKRERLGLVSFQFNGNWGDHGNFGMVLKRSVVDFAGGEWFRLDAKGVAECGDGPVSFIVMSLGTPKPPSATGRARS